MPGPRNSKKKARKSQPNKTRNQRVSDVNVPPKPVSTPPAITTPNIASCASTPVVSSTPPISPRTTAPNGSDLVENEELERLLQEDYPLEADDNETSLTSTTLAANGSEELTPPLPTINNSIALLEVQALAADQNTHIPDLPLASSTTPPTCPSVQEHTSDILLEEPYIFDPGSGPRVRNARAFLDSYFAMPVSNDDALCEEFGKEEVLDMLLSVLPEELALILWYNKSRITGRVCPTCRRLYRVGDALRDLTLGPDTSGDAPPSKSLHSSVLDQQRNEQDLSGLCSPICFIMASYHFAAAAKATWGRAADDLDDETWAMLNSPAASGKAPDSKEGEGDPFLGLIVRMTRLSDLGLAQMLFPGEGLEDSQNDQEDDEGCHSMEGLKNQSSGVQDIVDLSNEVD